MQDGTFSLAVTPSLLVTSLLVGDGGWLRGITEHRTRGRELLPMLVIGFSIGVRKQGSLRLPQIL